MSEEPAVWRPNPIVERQIALAQQTERAKSRLAWGLGIASLGICPIACLGSCFASVAGALGPPVMIFLASSVAFGLLLRKYVKTATLAKVRRAALRAEFAEVEGWFVRLSVVQGEAVSGRDMGTIWFEDGRLYFAGARTSFGLGVGDTEGKALPGDTLLDAGAHYVLPLRATTEVGALSVALSFLTDDAVESFPNEERFRRALREWFAQGEPARGQLPPFDLGSDLPSESLLKVRATLSTAALPTVLVLLALAMVWRGEDRFVAALIATVPLAFFAMLYSPGRSRRAVRDRRRLGLAMRQDRDR